MEFQRLGTYADPLRRLQCPLQSEHDWDGPIQTAELVVSGLGAKRSNLLGRQISEIGIGLSPKGFRNSKGLEHTLTHCDVFNVHFNQSMTGMVQYKLPNLL
mmetsp:Transcript_2202/g.3216  ORF Transcript_2202/g.3216 Transcript_2202/m.3216 type:complete len:101 (+) Transcript_2202:1024-1326(+)